jgi:hypothetical protein
VISSGREENPMDAEANVERFEVKFRPAFKAKVAEAARREGVPLGEMIVRAACRGLGFPEEEAVAARKLPGRKPRVTAEPPAGRRAGRPRKKED